MMDEQMRDAEQTQSVGAETGPTAPVDRKKKIIKEAKSFIVIILSVLAFRSVLFEPFKIPSGSMIPTLLIGDFILVNKFAYGFKVPFSDWFSDPIYLTGPEAPKRGDVIVFKYPKDPNLNYIKRVIGLPGDTVEVIDKVVYVNNEPITTTTIDGKKIMEDMDERYKSYEFEFLETQTGDAKHITQVDKGNDYFANFYKITVPKDQYFVMGDNRDFSADSRRWGTVPFGHIKGKAILIWFSLSVPWPGSEDEQETWKFRPWRIGKLID
ncbi:MAG TPA: signal peptidase I [Bacteriovoracaceae bacterium]|nr:signal peptidase I [Bacteriovoracaceae bacterium]HLW57312.1 signal peptidase I [Bacteriovoracaceae bacterium]